MMVEPRKFRKCTLYFVLWSYARFKLRATKPLSVCSANLKHFERIKLLRLEHTTRFFGPNKIGLETEMTFANNYTTHRVVVNKWSKIVGYAEFMHFPLIQALPRDSYMDWLNHHFCIPLPLSMSNILFFNHFTFSNTQMPQILHVLLKEIFLREQKVLYILTVEMPRDQTKRIESPDLPQYFAIEHFSTVYYPRVYNLVSCRNTQRIHVITRESLLENLRYRKAIPEDNDDIIEIISAGRPDLVKEHGEFFISEQLLREDEEAKHEQIITAELDHSTYGFFWLTDNIDVLKMIRNYEVSVFDYLIKFDPTKKYHVVTQELRQLAQERHSRMVSEKEIESIFDNEVNYYEEQLRFGEVFMKIDNLEKALTSAAFYQKPYTETLRISINIPDDLDVTDENVLESVLQDHSNVFGFQLMGIKHNIDLRRIYRFLLTAFSMYKDRDYCILGLPMEVPWPDSLNEFLNHFIRVAPRPDTSLPNQVFITHRSSVLGDLIVHIFSEDDVQAIEELISPDHILNDMPANKRERMEKIEESIVKFIMNDILTNSNTKYSMMTIRCGDSSRPVHDNVIIGFVIMRPFYDMQALHNHFQLPTLEVDELYDCGEIVVLKLPPLYYVHANLIFRDIARISEYWRLVYLQPDKSLTNDLANYMQPLEPKLIKKQMKSSDLQPRITDNEEDFLKYLNPVDYIRDKFAVYTQNLRESKIFKNKNRILILGFTEVTKAFLRKMVFNWNSLDRRFSQTYCCIPKLRVFVIAEPGELEASYQGRYPCKTCTDFHECWCNFENSSSYIRDTIHRMDLRKYVFFINGNVSHIDRTNFNVVLDNGCKYYYDYLLLFCYSNFGFPSSIQCDPKPLNYAHINNRHDRLRMYHKLSIILKGEKARDDNFRFLIYGSQLHTFSFIDFLITHGVKPKWVTLAVPHRKIEDATVQELNNPFVDYPIEESCEDMVEDMGVTVLRNHKFIDWHYHDGTDIIADAQFEVFPTSEQVTIGCDYFVSFNPCHMLPHIVDMLDAADIGLDEQDHIFVDANHRTNDWRILAVGNHISIHNYTSTPNYQFKFVNFKEQAEKIIRTLDIAVIPRDTNRRYFQPAYFQVNLPQDHVLVKVTMPKRYLAGQLPNHMCSLLSTYHEGTFCRIRLTDHGIVEEITVIGKVRHMSLDFLQFFCGKHESLLNNLHAHWCYGDIPCILKFLTEPWTELLLHDNFPNLLSANKDILRNAFAESCKKPLTYKELKRNFKKVAKEKQIQKELETTLLGFLRKYRDDFEHPFALPEDLQK